MRTGIKLMLVVAAALGAAAPAHAQRQSLADRVGAIEQQMYNNSSNQDLLNQLSALRQQVQGLQSTIEQLQHDNAQLKQSNQDAFLDLDERINRLESGSAPAAPALPALPDAGASAPQVKLPAENAPVVRGDASALAATGDERAAYNVAFDALKAGKYDDSAQLFISFLELYPQGVYAPNALYWLGESYYATRNFDMAEARFRELISRYPTHDKASGGLLKVGLSQFGAGKVEAAQQTLESVVTQYPGSDAARTAQDRLQAIRLNRQLR